MIAYISTNIASRRPRQLAKRHNQGVFHASSCSSRLHVTSPQAQAWRWPFWNLDSVYFLSTTAITEAVTLKTRAYLNSFDNLLRGFDDRTQTT